MTDAELQRLGQIIADQVCRRAIEQVGNWFFCFLVAMFTFWMLRIAFLFLDDFKKEMQE